jgi:shikimate dehydrogenase
MNFTILGENILHSLSPKIFKQFFINHGINANYNISNIKKSELQNFTNNSRFNLAGYNVTSPFKTKIINYLDILDDTAKIAKAVNVVKICDGKLVGYNSDIYGAKIAISNINNADFNNILIYGNGGVTPAIIYVLTEYFAAKNIYVVTSNFNDQIENINYISEDVISDIKNISLVINCSLPSKKMNFNIDFTSDCNFFDLSYIKSSFYDQVPVGMNYYNGKIMLLHQAIKAFEIWFGYKPNEKIDLD